MIRPLSPFSPRLGLKESLEEYQSRHGLAGPAGRVAWRFEGMRLLGLDPSKAVPDARYQPRICDQACPTENGPTVFEEDEPFYSYGGDLIFYDEVSSIDEATLRRCQEIMHKGLPIGRLLLEYRK